MLRQIMPNVVFLRSVSSASQGNSKEVSTFGRILCILILVLLFIQPLLAQTIDKIIVVVNDEIITQSDVDKVLSAIEAEYSTIYTNTEELEQKLKEAEENIINQMIEEKLILSEAKELDIEIDQARIDRRIEEIKEKFSSEEEFEKALERQELTLKNLRDRFGDQEIMKKAVEYFVRSEINLDLMEIRQFYQSHKSELVRPEKARLRNILIKAENEENEYMALQKAKSILGRLNKGENFEELARIYSQGANAGEGGDLGFIERGQLIKEIDEVVFALAPGEFSDVIRTNQGYRIFKLEEKKSKELLSFEEAQDEIRQILYNTKFTEVFKEWLAKLKEEAYIVIQKETSDGQK